MNRGANRPMEGSPMVDNWERRSHPGLSLS
jgi:hypothetical protein